MRRKNAKLFVAIFCLIRLLINLALYLTTNQAKSKRNLKNENIKCTNRSS